MGNKCTAKILSRNWGRVNVLSVAAAATFANKEGKATRTSTYYFNYNSWPLFEYKLFQWWIESSEMLATSTKKRYYTCSWSCNLICTSLGCDIMEASIDYKIWPLLYYSTIRVESTYEDNAMKKHLIRLMAIMILITTVLVAGCTSPMSNQTSNQSTTTTTKVATSTTAAGAAATTAQLPNPAAVFCRSHGGESRIVKNPDGSESGICIFCNGTVCDEWKYFRGECP